MRTLVALALALPLVVLLWPARSLIWYFTRAWVELLLLL